MFLFQSVIIHPSTWDISIERRFLFPNWPLISRGFTTFDFNYSQYLYFYLYKRFYKSLYSLFFLMLFNLNIALFFSLKRILLKKNKINYLLYKVKLSCKYLFFFFHLLFYHMNSKRSYTYTKDSITLYFQTLDRKIFKEN